MSLRSRIINVQLNNLDLICSKCSRIGKLNQLDTHKCQYRTAPPATRGKATCFASTAVPEGSQCESSNQQQSHLIRNAAKVLREEALKHKKGEPNPYEVERATDRWFWLKLQQSNRAAVLNTGGRVSDTQI